MNKLLITLGIALLFTSLACEVEMKSQVPPTQETKQPGVEATAEASVPGYVPTLYEYEHTIEYLINKITVH